MTDVEVMQALQNGLEHHQADRFTDAEPFYRSVLQARPEHPDALHLLGAMYATLGRYEVAIAMLTKACDIAPGASALHNTLGNALRDGGQFDKAVAAFERAVQLNPAFAEGYSNLGNAYADQRQAVAAIEAYRTALQIDPTLDRAYSNLGVILRETGQIDEAIACLKKAVELNPHSAIAHDNLAIALNESGRPREALAVHKMAIQLNPNSPMAHSNLSITLKELGRFDESALACERAIALKPDYADAYNNLGVARAEQGRVDDAIAAYRKAIELRPDYSSAHTNLGVSLADKGEFIEGLRHCRQAVALDPANPKAHFNLGVALLQTGDFDRGWDQYEWRLKCRGMVSARDFTQPRWDGVPLEGRRILIHCEQGIGDAIQFIRYVSKIVELGGRALVECNPALHSLFRKIPGVNQEIAPGDALPEFDVHCSIVSLPRIFKTAQQTIPARVPYLSADTVLAGEWHSRMQGENALLKIGLVWAGAPAHKNDRNRSMALSMFGPLALSAVQFFSLQRGPAAGQADVLPNNMRLIDLTPALYDWSDTAAMIANLDLVISVDTAVAHLAGAMGKPVWTLLPFNADWRWMIGRDSTPWYPTMRLFRQTSPGDWAGVVGRVREELIRMVHMGYER